MSTGSRWRSCSPLTHDKALHSRCVSIQHLIAALPEGHPLAPQPVIDVRTPGPMILPTKHETPGLFSRISALFDELGIQPNCSTPETWPSV
jgi:hypothetical protein